MPLLMREVDHASGDVGGHRQLAWSGPEVGIQCLGELFGVVEQQGLEADDPVDASLRVGDSVTQERGPLQLEQLLQRQRVG